MKSLATGPSEYLGLKIPAEELRALKAAAEAGGIRIPEFVRAAIKGAIAATRKESLHVAASTNPTPACRDPLDRRRATGAGAYRANLDGGAPVKLAGESE